MCKPDISLVTFRWIDHTAQHKDPLARYPTNTDSGLHECANWDALDSWAGERVFNLFDTDALKKPEHGTHYADRTKP